MPWLSIFERMMSKCEGMVGCLPERVCAGLGLEARISAQEGVCGHGMAGWDRGGGGRMCPTKLKGAAQRG